MAQWLSAEEFLDVLAAAQAGSEQAFDQIYRAYAGSITAYARVQGVSDPEDCTSETFISLIGALGNFHGDESAFRSWLFTIAHRRVIDIRRRQSRRLQVVPAEPYEFDRPAADDTEAAALDAAATADVRALVGQLVADQRDVLLLRLVGGLTIDEIAQNLNKTPGAVKALQRRGLSALKKIVDGRAYPYGNS